MNNFSVKLCGYVYMIMNECVELQNNHKIHLSLWFIQPQYHELTDNKTLAVTGARNPKGKLGISLDSR